MQLGLVPAAVGILGQLKSRHARMQRNPPNMRHPPGHDVVACAEVTPLAQPPLGWSAGLQCLLDSWEACMHGA